MGKRTSLATLLLLAAVIALRLYRPWATEEAEPLAPPAPNKILATSPVATQLLRGLEGICQPVIEHANDYASAAKALGMQPQSLPLYRLDSPWGLEEPAGKLHTGPLLSASDTCALVHEEHPSRGMAPAGIDAAPARIIVAIALNEWAAPQSPPLLLETDVSDGQRLWRNGQYELRLSFPHQSSGWTQLDYRKRATAPDPHAEDAR